MWRIMCKTGDIIYLEASMLRVPGQVFMESNYKHIVLFCSEHCQLIERQLKETKSVLVTTVQDVSHLRELIHKKTPDMILVHQTAETITDLRRDLNVDSIPICRISNDQDFMPQVLELVGKN